MNLLRNPWVTAALAIVAVVVVWRQLFPSRPDFGKPPEPVVRRVVPPSVTAPESVPNLNLAAKGSESTIDRDYILAHLSAWIALPDKDPFQLQTPHLVQPSNTTVESGPWARWKLQSIWRQPGSSLCVINSHIYAEGDMIDGYRIDKIEDGHVFLQGPKGRERLTIDKLEPDADTTPVPNVPPPPKQDSGATNSAVTNH